jgi:signal transduction histidine kinase
MSEPGLPLEPDHEAETATLRHDLRQYVAAGLVLAEAKDVDGLDPDVRQRLDTIAAVFTEIKEAVEDDEHRRNRPTAVDLAEVAKECVEVTRLVSKVPIALIAPRRLKACANISLLPRAVLNLLSNATRAAGTGGRVEVEVGRRGPEAWVEVRDDGAGFGLIPSGSGLGMAVVESLARSSGGRMEITSGPRPGTRVRLWLPRPQFQGARS